MSLMSGDTKPSQRRSPSPHRELLRTAELIELLPFSRSTLWRLVARNEFPQPLRLSTGVIAWRLDEVERWIEERNRRGHETS